MELGNLNKRMKAMPPNWRYRWCENGVCGCMGCANGSGHVGVTKSEWQLWVDAHPCPHAHVGSEIVVGDHKSKPNCFDCGVNL